MVKRIYGSINKHENISNKNIYIEDGDELKLISPFSCFVVGCTGSGKSITVLDWLKNSDKVFQDKFNDIYYFYGSTHQEIFNDPKLSHVKFSNDLKLLEKIIQIEYEEPGVLVVFDDLMNVTGENVIFQNLYTKGSHHLNISIINIIQNFFFKSKTFVTLKDNSQYIYIKRHVNEIKLKTLANAIGVGTDELMGAYHESDFKDRFGGILVDNHIKSNIRKISKIRDNLTSDSVGLYITDKNFSYYSNKNIIKKIGVGKDNYFLDLERLKDSLVLKYI